nr:hypothetical protein [Bacillus gaemokensis]
MYWIEGIIMVDDPNYGYQEPRCEVPLVKQRYHGYLPADWGV